MTINAPYELAPLGSPRATRLPQEQCLRPARSQAEPRALFLSCDSQSLGKQVLPPQHADGETDVLGVSQSGQGR